MPMEKKSGESKNDFISRILASGETYNVTLPSATGSGRIIVVKYVGVGTLTILTTGSDTIDGGSSKTISTTYDVLRFYDGASGKWYTI